jgi:hypothetical protein
MPSTVTASAIRLIVVAPKMTKFICAYTLKPLMAVIIAVL